MHFQLEFALLASEERRRRLLAEAKKLRLLKAPHPSLLQPNEQAASWLSQRIASIWRGLIQTLANPRKAKWFNPDFNL